MKRYLAIDLGASGGRGIVGIYENGKVTLDEVHRFESAPAQLSDGLHWDVIEIFRQIKLAMTAAANKYGKNGIDAMAIDSWGVDYGIIDKNGSLIHTPYHYRDLRTDAVIDEVHSIVPKKELYEINGLQFMNFNTVYQLYSHFKTYPYLRDCAYKFMMIPQLLGYFLTGKVSCEYTDASTTGLVNAKSRNWDIGLIERLGLPKDIFPEISAPASVLGKVRQEVCEETGLDVTVLHVASHDTASAVSALPYTDCDSIFISSGTWSLMGILSDEPMVDEKSFEMNFANEGNPEGKIRVLKNIMGMWLIQQARRVWNMDGTKRSYGEIAAAAEKAKEFEAFIDPDHKPFSVICNMPEEVRKYCRESAQRVPETEGETARVIYESLALKYRYNAEKIEKLTGRHFDAIQIVGGGVNNDMMNRFTANACGKKVIAGPVEATAMGNICLQLIADGQIKDIGEAGKVVAASENLKIYEPEDKAVWDEKYEKYLKITSR